MSIWVTVLLFLLGLALIVKGGDWFLDGAVWIAEATGVPRFIIGATIVSLATTLPELTVSVTGVLQGEVDLAVGNAVGSVTANLGLILGLSVVCIPSVVNRKQFDLKAILMVSGALLLFVLCRGGVLPVLPSLLLFVVFAVYLGNNVMDARSGMAERREANPKRRTVSHRQMSMKLGLFAAGIAAIAAFFLFVIACDKALEETAMLSIVLLGATLAFLRYNFAPATIFMGDSGSLMLGAMIGIISLMGVMRSPTVIVMAVPIVIAAIPIADTGAAIVRRLYHHQPIQQADRKHLHHMLLRKGYGVRKSVAIVYAWTIVLGVGAFLMSHSHGVAVFMVLGGLIIISFFILWRLGMFDKVLRHHYHGRHLRQEDKPRWYGKHGR